MSDEQSETTTRHGIGWKILFFLKFLEIRLRFVLILVITALVVGYWDHVENYYERWQRERHPAAEAATANAGDESAFEYFCPMHTFVIRERAGKCPICGMDLVQRKKGETPTLPAGVIARVQTSPERIMQAGVQVEPVLYHLLSHEVVSYGVIEAAEPNIKRIIGRFPGRVDQLNVNAVGLEVKQGDELARIYSPKFLAAGQEYLQALQNENQVKGGSASADEKSRAAQLTQFAKQRLLLAGYTAEQIDALGKQQGMGQTVSLFSPISGVVLEKNILQGEMVEEGTTLYTIADLGTLWVQVLVPERELGQIRKTSIVELTTPAHPGQIFWGTIDFIYPTVDPANRAGKVRIVVANPQRMLKPGMSINATLYVPVGRYGAPGTLRTGAAVAMAKNEKAKEETPAGHEVKKTKSAGKFKLPTSEKAEAEAFLATLAPGASYYECPMHAEVVSDKLDDCPKCGMHLAENKEGAKAAVPDETLAKPTAQSAIKLPTTEAAHAQAWLAGLKPGSTYYTCPMHPEVVSDKAGECPKCGMHLEARTTEEKVEGAGVGSLEKWATGWACPMHLDQLLPSGGECRIDNCGMPMRQWDVERVLAVPELAVIDTGTRHVVYVESSPGVFDARAVEVGARAGQFYPVLSGLEPGQKIASRGAFLIDAEARLNPTAVAPTAAPMTNANATTMTMPMSTPDAPRTQAGHQH